MDATGGRARSRAAARGPFYARRAAAVSALLAALLAADSARAQSVLGTIRGDLLDEEGDPLVAARIRVVDEITGVERETRTTATGDYEVPNLRAGTYRVEDGSPGLAAYARTGVVLSAGDTVRVDLRLGPVVMAFGSGEVRLPRAARGEELVISGEGSSNIQLESPALQVGLDQQQLASLPRGSRDYQDFLYLTANVLGHRERGLKHLSGLSYGAYLLQDGQPSNAVLSGVPARSSPGLYSIDELKVFSNSFAAEYGGTSAIVVTTRRGGNQLSGGGFYDFNADELNALSYDQKQAGRPRGFEGSDSHEHRYGAWLGGPIRKRKTFFFVNFEGENVRSVSGGPVARVPSERMRRGDFSELATPILDPETGQPFPGKVIPPERIDPAAQRILDFYYPLPRPELAPLPGGLGQYREFAALQSAAYRVDMRLDHELSPADSVFARLTLNEQDPGSAFLEPAIPPFGTQQRDGAGQIFATSWVHVFSSRVLNELRGGWNGRARQGESPYRVGEVADQLGIEVPSAARLLPGYPSLLFRGRSGGILEISDPSLLERVREESSLSFADTLTWLLGRHSLKLGGFFSRDRMVDSAPLGLSSVTGRLVFNDAAGFTGNAVADLLLGRPFQSIEGVNNRSDQPFDATSNVFAGFLQDDWRVSSHLTLFLGLRYEVESGFRERRGLMANLDPEGRRVIVPAANALPLVTVGSLAVETAGQRGVDPALVNPDTNNFAPRFGFAYRLDENKTVVRGGVGLFYPTSTAIGVRNLLGRDAFQATRVRDRPELARAFSTGELEPGGEGTVNAIDFDLQTPRFLQYNLTLERELPGDFGFRVSYLGSHADKLLISRRINTLPASSVPFDPSDPADRQRLPFPTLDTTTQKLENAGSGSLHALQLEASRRFRAGFGLYLGYTLSHTSTDARDAGNSTLGVVQYDAYDLAKNRGPDPGIPRHRFVMDATWDVPVGRRRAVDGLPVWLDALLGGWTVATIVQARSGLFMTPFYNNEDQANTGLPADSAWRPDLVGDPSGSRDRNSFINLAAFSRPAPGTLGNAPAGVIEGPGLWVANLGFYKQLVSGPRFVLEARVTLDNALNHPQFFVDPVAPGEFLNLTDYLVNGRPATERNGTTNVLRTVRNTELFAAGRVVRLGLQLRF